MSEVITTDRPPPDHGDWQISLANEQSAHAVDEAGLVEAARRVLADSEFNSAAVSLAVVDDPTLHGLNRRYLQHDWPTDVLSFVLAAEGDHLEGEVVLSADTAAAAAEEAGWSAAAEQLLYVVHGMLHLVGYDDASPALAQEMRAAEQRYLAAFGYRQPTGSTGLTSPTGATPAAAANFHSEGGQEAT